jgi:hypothetical protein
VIYTPLGSVIEVQPYLPACRRDRTNNAARRDSHRMEARQQPAGTSWPNRTVCDSFLDRTGQLREQSRRCDDQVESGGADISRRVQQRPDWIRPALQPRRLLVEPSHSGLPHDDFHFCASFMQQCCRFESALPSTYNYGALTGIPAEIAMRGRM